MWFCLWWSLPSTPDELRVLTDQLRCYISSSQCSFPSYHETHLFLQVHLFSQTIRFRKRKMCFSTFSFMYLCLDRNTYYLCVHYMNGSSLIIINIEPEYRNVKYTSEYCFMYIWIHLTWMQTLKTWKMNKWKINSLPKCEYIFLSPAVSDLQHLN